MERNSSVGFGGSTCRISSSGRFEPAAFRSIACAKCLLFIFLSQPPYNYTRQNVCPEGVLNCDPLDPSCNCNSPFQPKYNLPEFSLSPFVLPVQSMHLKPPLPQDFESPVRKCCEAAERCCMEVLQKDVEMNGTCPATWDGWSCFSRSNAGVIQQFCPAYIFGNRWRRHVDIGAMKKCEEGGMWEKVVQNGVLQERTDYKGCHQEEPWLKPLIMFTFIAYCISAIAILPALLLLSCNRRIKNLSIFFIHRQLLLCLFLDACCYIVSTLLFMPAFRWQADFFFENHFICRLLFVIQYGYFKLASFAWMLAEALHLRWLLFSSPSNHIESANRMLICTWGGPAIIAVIYGVLIEKYERDTCMPESNNLFIRALITIPCTVCLLVNTVILCITVRLILQKLRTNQMNSSIRNYRKIMHALLVLIPLFGVNLASAIWSTESDAHDILNFFVNGFEGFIVSMVVCWANRTVIQTIASWTKSTHQQLSFRQYAVKPPTPESLMFGLISEVEALVVCTWPPKKTPNQPSSD